MKARKKPFFTGSVVMLISVLSVPQITVQAQSDSNELVLEEVVVTARKREENLQDAPISITTFSGEDIRARHILNIGDVSHYTPNLQFNQVAPNSGFSNSSDISIRGIGQSDFVLVIDPGVGIFLDGVYIGRSVGGLLDTVDVDSIEVLKGPQGTLFGKNTIGGALVINSAKPNQTPSGALDITTGRYDRLDVSGSVNTPLSDTFAIRANVSYQSRNGYMTRLTTGEKQGNKDSLAGRISALWTPSDNFELLVAADGTTADEQGPNVLNIAINDDAATDGFFAGLHNTLFSGNAAVCDNANNDPARLTTPECFNSQYASSDKKSNYATGPNESDVDTWGVMANAELHISESVSIKSITSYREISAFSGRDLDSTPIFLWDNDITYKQNQFTQELQLAGTGFDDRLDWLVGAFYMLEEGNSRDTVLINIGTLFSGGSIDNDTWAIFTHLAYDVTDRITLNFGARYTDEKKRWLPDQTFGASRLLPFVEATSSASEFTPSVTLQYVFTEDVNGYFTYSKGFKGGGFTQRIGPPGIQPAPGQNPVDVIPKFKPEFAENYEIGFKSELFDRRMRLNGAVFYTDYTDLQINVRIGIAPTVRNAGDVEVYGAELEFEAVASEWLQLNGGVGYVHHEYDTVSPDAVGVTIDKKLPNAPKWSGTLGFTADFPFMDSLDLAFRGDFSYKSGMYKDSVNTPLLKQDGVGLINLSARLSHPNTGWHLTAEAKHTLSLIHISEPTRPY